MVVGRGWLKGWNRDLDIESVMGERIVKTKTVYNRRTYPTFRYAEVLLYGVLGNGELVLLSIRGKCYPTALSNAKEILEENKEVDANLNELRKAVVGKRLGEIVREV